jgi:hypothetical protein
MGDLNIKTIPIEEAINLKGEYDVMLKVDGTLMYYTDGVLFSARKIVRNDRFGHIVKILKEANFPNCYGEIFIEGRGKNVFDVSRKENWKIAKMMIIDIIDNSKPYSERQKLLRKLVSDLSNDCITPLIRFTDVTEGWNWVLENEAEGLVLRNERDWFKVKKLFEAKVEIKEHEPSKEKGTFILIDNNRVSGTSMDFVRQFKEIKARGKTPIMELEYPFKTEAGHYFQARCRRIFQQEVILQEAKK